MARTEKVWVAGDEEGPLAASLREAGKVVHAGRKPAWRSRPEVLVADRSHLGPEWRAGLLELLGSSPPVAVLLAGLDRLELEQSPALAFSYGMVLAPVVRDSLVRMVEDVASDEGSVPRDGRQGALRIRFDFPSRVELVQPVAMLATRECRAAGFPEDHLSSAVPLCLTEVLVNAVQHGNRCEPELRVRLRVEVGTDRFHCVVEDEGEGFDPSAVPEPTTSENLLRDHGRGLFLVRHFMDEVAYNARGNVVALTLLAGSPAH